MPIPMNEIVAIHAHSPIALASPVLATVIILSIAVCGSFIGVSISLGGMLCLLA